MPAHRRVDRTDNEHKADASAQDAQQTGFDDVFYSAPDGLRLHARDYGRDAPGAKARLPVVCLPGLTRNARDFHRLALFLSQHQSRPRRVVAFDYRGRGLSQWDSDTSRYALPVEAEDVLAGMAALGLDHAAFIGTSRGALIVHVLAGMRPAVLDAVVLNDAGPALEGAGLAQIKSYLERMPRPADWREAAAILKSVHGKAFPALNDRDWSEMAEAIFTRRNGRIRPDFDPALVSLLKDLDFDTPIPTLWPQFDGLRAVPLMTVRGEHSTLLSTATVAEMKARHPGMTVVEAKGQGHAPVLHLSPLAEQIAAFLRAADL